MEHGVDCRPDLISIVNTLHFVLRHYARGYYPVDNASMQYMAVNRIFFPLENSGGAENFIADSSHKYELIPGRMYFIPAFLPVRFQLDSHLYFLSIHTNMEIFPGVELFSGCRNMVETAAPDECRQLLRIFDERDPEKRWLNAVRAGQLIYSVNTGMIEHYAPEDFWKTLALHKYTDLIDYLERNGSAMTQVSDLAGEKNISRENFTRHFTVDTGITPKQLIDRFITGRCLELVESGIPFREIALKLKFRDEFAFSRYFKRNMGVSPRAWSKRMNGDLLMPMPFHP